MNTPSSVEYLRLHKVHHFVERQLATVLAGCNTPGATDDPVASPRPLELLAQCVPTIACMLSAGEIDAVTMEALRCLESLERHKIRHLATLDYDAFAVNLDGPGAVAAVAHMFETALGDAAPLRQTLLRWIVVVRSQYHDDNPFHNFRHAFNVLQTLFSFLQSHRLPIIDTAEPDGVPQATCIVADLFSPVEVFSMMFAALCHDLQHPGVTNGFLSQMLHPLALRYNDQAVLEHHHAAIAFATLDFAPLESGAHNAVVAGPSFCDVTETFSRRRGMIPTKTGSFSSALDFLEFRAHVIRCILGTEVAAHKRHLQTLKDTLCDTLRTTELTVDVSDALKRDEMLRTALSQSSEGRHALMVALVQAADISNEIRATPIASQWAPFVVEEFCRQGDQMKKLCWSSEIPAMFRRGTACPEADQPGFIEFLCLPLYRALAEILPQPFQWCVANLEANKAHWLRARQQREEAGTK